MSTILKSEKESLLSENNFKGEVQDSDQEEEVIGSGRAQYEESRQQNRIMDFNSKIVEQKQGKPQQNLILTIHFLFKLLAFVFYEFSKVLGMRYIGTFVFVLLFLSVDFWVTKNLSGRLLAGFRWWNTSDETTGKSVWRFESWTLEERQLAYKSQVNFFWFGLFAQQSVWSILFLSAMFSLSLGWCVITVIACALNGANLYGYIRCRLHRKGESPGLISRARDLMMGIFKTPGGSYTPGQQADS